VLDRQLIKVEIGRKASQKREKFVVMERCRVLHLLSESCRFEPSPALF
jgi:hypothetical protein